MRRVVINMQNCLFGDAIAGALRSGESDFEVYTAEKPEEVAEMCGYLRPFAVLLEVTACEPWLLSERLKLRDELKSRRESGKIVLIVDENSEKELALKVRQAKKDGLIDQFVFGSVSAAYLTAVVDSL